MLFRLFFAKKMIRGNTLVQIFVYPCTPKCFGLSGFGDQSGKPKQSLT